MTANAAPEPLTVEHWPDVHRVMLLRADGTVVAEVYDDRGDALATARSMAAHAVLVEALEAELTDAIAEIERLCGAMSREKFNDYVDGSRRVQRLRAALAVARGTEGDGHG